MAVDIEWNKFCDKETQIDENNIFNSETCELNGTKVFTLNRPEDYQAVKMLALYGHYYYSLHSEFRQKYKELFEEELCLPNTDYDKFLTCDYYTILYYGFIVNKFIQDTPAQPHEYLASEVPMRNQSLQKYVQENKCKIEPGIPYYYEQVVKAMVSKSAIDGSLIVINPMLSIINLCKEKALELNKFAQVVFNAILANGQKITELNLS